MELAGILLYPIKSFDGVRVEAARITPGGFLAHDRVYAVVDAAGVFVNGKRDARVHHLRATYDSEIREVRLRVDGDGQAGQFVLSEPAPLNAWLSDYFAMPVQLRHDSTAGFPDDHKAPGPTIVSRASLRAVAGWFPGFTFEGVRGRFRTNLELDGPDAAPFWEDRLFGAPDELRPFGVGPVTFRGHNPCQRCAVPTRDPQSGLVHAGFQREFMERRRTLLPPWSNSTRFNHYYRFAINTSIPSSEAGKSLRVGDAVEWAVAAKLSTAAR